MIGSAEAGPLDRLIATAPREALPEPSFPNDLGTHPDAPFESRGWYVLLVAPNGTVRATRQQFDRVSLRPDQARGTSNWRFDAVMQVRGSQGSLGTGAGDAARPGARTDWQHLQRVALGLADTAWPGRDTPAVSNFGVLGHRLGYEAQAAGCRGRYSLSVPGEPGIAIEQRRCPHGQSFAATASALSGAMPAVAEDGARGVAWQRHAWGALPDAAGAVRFDLAVLTLRGLGTVELVRSRRRSGRGTPVVTARLLDSAGWRPVADVSWPVIDRHPRDDGGGGESQADTVRIDSLGVDVRMFPLPLPGDGGPLPDPVAWRGALFAQGSHSGAGFAEIAARGEQSGGS